MYITGKAIDRRAFLHGTGAALALPLLDAMTPAFATGAARPTRLAFFQVPNGIMNLQNEFSQKTPGPLTEMPPILQPLAEFKDRILTFSGLDSQQAAGLGFEIAGDHPRACTAWLTGTHAKMTAGADLLAGKSADQFAAEEFGKETQLASLEIALESSEVVGSCEAAYSCAYFNTISWRDETTPNPMEHRPRALFERLFGAAGTTDQKVLAALRREDRSILDAVSEDVKRLRGKLGGKDRSKIDQYTDAVRDVERRIQRAEAQKDREIPALEGPGGVPGVFSDYYKLMTDLMVLASQTDMTRVMTFQMGHEMSLRSYPELGFTDSHHSQTHHHGEAEKIAKVIAINTLHTKMLAYYLGKLRDTSDGDGSLLDHSLIMYGAALSDANLHRYDDLSILMVGGGVNGIKGGYHLKYPQRTPLANLLLTMLDKAGVPNVQKLGDSTGKLDLAASVRSVEAASQQKAL